MLKMSVSVRPRAGGEFDFMWPVAEGTEPSAYMVAQRAVALHDPTGDGKVRVEGWTYKYICGKIQPAKHC